MVWRFVYPKGIVLIAGYLHMQINFIVPSGLFGMFFFFFFIPQGEVS